MIHHIVYRTTDRSTGEYYIGFHSYDDQDPLVYFGSYKKYTNWRPNEDNLIRETLMQFSTRDAAREAEPEFIKLYFDDPLCQNLSDQMMPEAFDMYGKNHTPETIEKISKNNVGMKGKNHTEETKKKQSKAKKGKPKSEEHRKNISKANIGKPKIKTISKIVTCPYCNKFFAGRGIGSHKRHCKKK